MGARPRHPSKDIEAAVAGAERDGWSFTKTQGHGWGQLWCPRHDRDGCRVSVWATPRNPVAHARSITRAVARCPHGIAKDKGEDNGRV